MQMDASIGARLDRLPLSGFHWRLLGLIAAGMYFDSFDIYIAGTVLAAMIHSGESTLSLNATFVSVTFIGMMTGAWLSGLLGDRFGRRTVFVIGKDGKVAWSDVRFNALSEPAYEALKAAVAAAK